MLKKIYTVFVAVVFGLGLQSSALAQTCTTIGPINSLKVDGVTSGTLTLTNQSKVCETTASLIFTYNKGKGTRQLVYGKTTSYGTNGPNLVDGLKTAELTGLEPGTKYYLKIDGVYGSLKYTLTGTFTTNGGSTSTPPAFAQASRAVACTTSKVMTITAAATGTAPIVYTLSNQPPWITINGSTITFAPVSGSKNETVTLTATNGKGSANQTLNVSVFTQSTEIAPSFPQTSRAVACTTSKITTEIASAAGTAPITYSLSNQPPWITINGSTITFAPVSGSKNETVTLTATNSKGSASQTLNVTVFTESAPTCNTIDATTSATSRKRFQITGGQACATTATINYSSDYDNGQVQEFRWGTTTTYGQIVDVKKKTTNGSFTLNNLTPNTTYYYNYYCYYTRTNPPVTISFTGTFKTSGGAPQVIAPKFASATVAVTCTTSKATSYTASATGDAPISYSISGQPSWIILGNNGVITLTTPSTVQTVPAITITATNNAGTATQTLNVTIVETPVIAKNDVAISFSTSKWAATDTFCLIAWIEDNAGAFIKTLAVWGKNAEDLADVEPWLTVAKSPTDTLGNTVDAVTSPTLIGNKNLSVSWNGTDVKKAAVPNGTYKFCVSGGIDGGPFPVSRTPFTMNGSKKTITGVATSEFKNIVVTINGGTTPVTPQARKSNCANDFLLNIGNTPIYVPSSGKSMSVCIYSLNGSLVMKKIIPLESGSVNVPVNDFITGTYICKISTSSEVVSQKIMVQK